MEKKGIVEILYCPSCNSFTVVDMKKLWCTKECPKCESREIQVWEEKEEKENNE